MSTFTPFTKEQIEFMAVQCEHCQKAYADIGALLLESGNQHRLLEAFNIVDRAFEMGFTVSKGVNRGT